MNALKIIIRGTLANIYLIKSLIFIWEKVFESQFTKAWGLYTTSRVKNIGLNSRFLGKSIIMNPENLVIGNNVRVGKGCFLFCMGGLSIGSGTILSRNITIYTANHRTDSCHIPYDNEYQLRSVDIGKGVWIGMNASIVPGVKIGDGAIIGMNTVVTEDIPAGYTVVGSKCRLIKKRDMSEFDKKIKDKKVFSIVWPES
jgi:acetyltransferase-like isoleucine patch superfamily enzyme